MKQRKIVFVLGAGFSKAAGYPLQKEILPRLFGLPKGAVDKDLLRFIKDCFPGKSATPLEDIYTGLDKAISGERRIYKYAPRSLREHKRELDRAIAALFTETVAPESMEYLERFANLLKNIRIKAGQPKDPLSVITTNWDFLLEEAFVRLNEISSKKQLRRRRVVVDYCTFEHQLDPQLEKVIPRSLFIKASGWFNLKILKLHGSVSWIKCPRCDSLFVAFRKDKLEAIMRGFFPCRICEKNLGLQTKLDLFQLSPTFVKEMGNVHYRMIWWNAGFELSEATHLVFVGYSLPSADFELRNLLLSRLSNRAMPKIKVVQYRKSGDEGSEAVYAETVRRYKDFFGGHISDSDFSPLGAFDYIDRIADLRGERVWKFHESQWRWASLR